jgi:hypothetical protein
MPVISAWHVAVEPPMPASNAGPVKVTEPAKIDFIYVSVDADPTLRPLVNRDASRAFPPGMMPSIQSSLGRPRNLRGK